jgi:DNA modification methylase
MAEQTNETTCNVDFKNEEGLKYLETIDNNSVDLILTDPPYIISKETGICQN